MMSQIVADTLSGKWEDGIRISDYKQVLRDCSRYKGKLDHLLDSVTSEDIGRSEPVAAGAARLLAEKTLGRLLLMVDIGAGTTDFALLRILPPNLGGSVTPIAPSAAVNYAGDRIDALLIDEITSKAPLTDDQLIDVRRAIKASGIRTLKKELFQSGEISVTLVTHDIVKVEKDAFLSSEKILRFKTQLAQDIQKFLDSVDSSYAPLVERPIMVISGGSAQLPFLKELHAKDWVVAGVQTKFDPPRKPIPTAFAKFTETDISQLAVAIGGAVTDVNERDIMAVYQGATRPPALRANQWV